MSESLPPTHDSNGRFAPGNQVNKGGNPTSRAKRVRMKIKREAAEEMLRNEGELIRSMVKSVSTKAREGDLRAIEKLEAWLSANEHDLADEVAEIKRRFKAAARGNQ